MATATTTKLTHNKFCESFADPALARAVVRQFGGWESFTESAPDVCRGGISGGFHGFIYYTDTVKFASRNRDAIMRYAEDQARDFGSTVGEMVAGFGCFRHDKLSPEAVMRAIWNARDDNRQQIYNALAWYAGEEVCRAYCDATGED